MTFYKTALTLKLKSLKWRDREDYYAEKGHVGLCGAAFEKWVRADLDREDNVQAYLARRAAR